MIERWYWFYAILGSALFWFIHLMASYTIAEFACVNEKSPYLLLMITSLLCFTGSFTSSVVALRYAKLSGELSDNIGAFAWSGFLFTLAIVSQSLPIFSLLSRC